MAKKPNLTELMLQFNELASRLEEMLGDQFYLAFRNYPVVDVKVSTEELPERYQSIKVSPNKIALKDDLKTLTGEALEELKQLAELADNYSPQFGNK